MKKLSVILTVAIAMLFVSNPAFAEGISVPADGTAGDAGWVAVGAGLALVNLGLIARQRIILYPFMFMIIYAYSDKRVAFLRKKRQQAQEKRYQEIAELQKT